MADQFALIEAEVPSATGTQDYTSASISNWSLAIFCWSGDYIDESNHANMGFCVVRADDGTDVDSAAACAYFREGRTTSSFCRSTSEARADGTGAIRVLDPDSGGVGVWAEASFSAALSNGVRMNWTDVSGVSLGVRGFKLWILLIGGTTDVHMLASGATTPFEADLLLALGASSTINAASDNHCGLGIGGCANDGSLSQASTFIQWPGAEDPVLCFAYASSDDFISRVSTAGVASTEQVTAFSGTGWTQSGSVTASRTAILFSDTDRPKGVAIASFSGSGTQTVTPLSFTPKILIGAIVGATTPDAVDSTSGAQVFGVFATNGTSTFCVSIATADGQAVSAGTPTVGFSRWASGEVNLISSSGGTAFRATSLAFVSGGISWSVQTAMSGHVFLWAIGESNLLAVSDDTERISDGHFLNLISRRVINESVSLSDGLGGLFLADGLTALNDTGAVFGGNPDKGTVLQGGAVAGVVEG